MSPLTYALIFGATLFFVISWWRALARDKAIKRVAVERGFIADKDIPASMNFRETGLAGVSSTWNVIHGDQNGAFVIAFDCRIGKGKGSWRRTVIAARSSREVFGSAKFDTSLVVERAGEWTILYRPKKLSLSDGGLMPAEEIKAHVENV